MHRGKFCFGMSWLLVFDRRRQKPRGYRKDILWYRGHLCTEVYSWKQVRAHLWKPVRRSLLTERGEQHVLRSSTCASIWHFGILASNTKGVEGRMVVLVVVEEGGGVAAGVRIRTMEGHLVGSFRCHPHSWLQSARVWRFFGRTLFCLATMTVDKIVANHVPGIAARKRTWLLSIHLISALIYKMSADFFSKVYLSYHFFFICFKNFAFISNSANQSWIAERIQNVRLVLLCSVFDLVNFFSQCSRRFNQENCGILTTSKNWVNVNWIQHLIGYHKTR